MNYVILVLLIAVGVYDLYLALKKHPTLSQQYQRLLPTWMDVILFGCILFNMLTCFMWVDWRLKVVIMGIIGHIVWPNKERYEKSSDTHGSYPGPGGRVLK